MWVYSGQEMAADDEFVNVSVSPAGELTFEEFCDRKVAEDSLDEEDEEIFDQLRSDAKKMAMKMMENKLIMQMMKENEQLKKELEMWKKWRTNEANKEMGILLMQKETLQHEVDALEKGISVKNLRAEEEARQERARQEMRDRAPNTFIIGGPFLMGMGAWAGYY